MLVASSAKKTMSLVGSADLSAPSYDSPMLYPPNSGNSMPGMSTQMFNSRPKFACVAEPYRHDHYDSNYFFDSSPCEENPFHLQCESPYQQLASSDSSLTAQDSFELEYLEIRSPDPTNYDEDNMRLKLQELERVLLDDNVDDDDDQSFEMDGEWTDSAIDNALVHESPKESSSSDSNLSTISSNKEISVISHTPKQLLFDCAQAISQGRVDEASHLINGLRQMVSVQGDPPQRTAAYMVEGLAARMVSSGKFLYKALKCKEPPTSDHLAAMQILFEVCPCFKFGYMAANGMIKEAIKGERRVHIIDFDVNQGNQYIALIQTLAGRSGHNKLPRIRLTGVDDPNSVQREVGGLKIVGQRLEKLAEALKVPFEFRAVASEASNVTPAMLGCRSGEALLVNFAYQLHHMPDESVSVVNQRDQLLRMVKSLNPKLVTIVEQDVNTNTNPFFPRFVEAYSYYSSVFESLDATLPRESQDRMNVERQCLAREIVNIVACEGEDRFERYEVSGKWRARMMMAGFAPSVVSSSVNGEIKEVIARQYCNLYKAREEMGALHFGWEEKTLVFASAWR